MKAKDLDKTFDMGDDITMHLDFSKAHRPKHAQKRVNVDFPTCIRTYKSSYLIKI